MGGTITKTKVRHMVATPRKTGYCKITLVRSSHGTLGISELPVRKIEISSKLHIEESVMRESGISCPNSTGDD
jgi:hypothetical protein